MIKCIFRFIKFLIVYLVVVLPLMVVGMLVIPIAFKFRRGHGIFKTNLPKWAIWFDNFEDGIWGDMSNHNKNRMAGINPFGLWAAYKWLAFRNSLHYFKRNVLGYPPYTLFTLEDYQEKSYTDVYPVGDYSNPGYRISEFLVNNKLRYEYYWIHRWGSSDYCLRARFGWKMGSIFETNDSEKGLKWVFTINPLCPYRGG